MRIASAFGIVWFHSGAPGRNVGYAGLVAFLMLSVYLAGRSGPLDANVLKRRAGRLLVPWLFWFAVYAALNAARGRPPVSTEDGAIAGILSGPSIHLWYMPFVFLCLVALDMLRTRLSGRSLAFAGAGLALLILATTPLWRTPSLALAAPLPQWMHAAPAVLAGFFLLHRDRLPRSIAAALLLALFLGAVWTLPWDGVGLPYLIGLAAVALVARDRPDGLARLDLRPLSESTLGIYFMHILVLGLLSTVGGLDGVVLPVATFAVSALAVLALRRAFPRLARYWS